MSAQNGGRPTAEAELEARFDGLIDLVSNEGKTEFLYLDPAGELLHGTTVELNEGRLVTPPARKKIPFPPCDLAAVLDAVSGWNEQSTAQLYHDIRDHIAGSVRLPEPQEAWLDTCAAWVFHTYVLELVTHSPMILLQGTISRGKTRLGKALTHLAYRGVHTANARQAFLSRYADNYGATLFLDIADFNELTKGSEAAEMILSRYEKGLTISRVTDLQAGRFNDTTTMELFGPTIIATNSDVTPATRSRSIAPIMPDASHVILGEPSTFEATAGIRARLLAWRIAMLREKALPHVDRPVPGRLGEITRPLVQVMQATAPDKANGLIAHIETLERTARDERAATLDGRTVRALLELVTEVERGLLPVAKITTWLNRNRGEDHEVTPQAVGRKLDHLGIKTKKINGHSKVVYDREQVAGLAGTWCADDATRSEPNRFRVDVNFLRTIPDTESE